MAIQYPIWMSRLALLFFFFLSLLPAQTLRGLLSVTVRDGSKAIVRDANLVLTHTPTGRTWNARTDSAGAFSFALLPPGDYKVTIDSPGFRRSVTNVTLHVNQEQSVELLIQPGDRTETIEVFAADEALKTDTQSLGATIQNRQIVDLPLNGRNFQSLALLVPGVTLPAQGSSGTVRGDFTFNANGARDSANGFTLDGVYNGDPKLNGVGVTPSVDAIREFEVLTGNYDASFARNAGGQVNVVLKSGTNALHGSLYHFFRNQAMDARNFFAPAGPDPRYQRNQFGAAAGGRIVKDRTFFFADFESRLGREGISRSTRVPTALERVGNFSQSDPRTPPIDLFTQMPFPGNIIPAQRLHPIALGIASLYPLPNRADPAQNFTGAPVARDGNHSFDLKFDHRLARNSDLSARYSFSDRDFLEPFAGAAFSPIPGFGSQNARRGQNLMISEVHAFRPNLLNELRLGFNRVALGVTPEQQAANLNARVGLPSPSDPINGGLSYISIAGFGSLGDEYNNPQRGITNTYQLVDQLTWTRNRHTFQFGFDYRVQQQNAYRNVLSRGLLSFVGFTGNALAEMMQGLVSVSSRATGINDQRLRARSASFFAQDAWKLTSKLTLTYGVRYEFATPPVDANNRASIYNFSNGQLNQLGTNGIPRGAFLADKNNLAPRLGLAYALNEKTVLRAGYGLYYDQAPLAPGEGIYFNPPYYNVGTYFTFQQYNLLLHDPFPANFPLALPPSAVTFQRDLRTAYLQNFSFNVQRQLGSGRVLEVGYVGAKGTKLHSGRDINQAGPSANPQNLRPNPFYGDITAIESRSNSNYHALQARFEQRVSRGLSLLGSYALGKSIDDASNFFSSAADPNYPMDSNNWRLERARSSFDVRQRLSVAYVYDLPLARGNKWLGGWQTNGVWSFQSGRPFSVSLLSDLDRSNTGRTNFGFGANDRPNRLADGRLTNPTPERWFDTAAFALQPFGSLGNSGRNILTGPGLANLDVSITKNTMLSERLNLQFRAEAFNVANRANFDLPDSVLGSGTYGRILSSQAPRHLQLGIKLLF